MVPVFARRSSDISVKKAAREMGDKFAEIAFTDSVKSVQRAMGSRRSYARREGGPDFDDRLGPDEAAFIAARDSFYIASVSETGWPYVQFRGGPPGFLRVLDDRTLGYADFRGNLQSRRATWRCAYAIAQTVDAHRAVSGKARQVRRAVYFQPYTSIVLSPPLSRRKIICSLTSRSAAARSTP